MLERLEHRQNADRNIILFVVVWKRCDQMISTTSSSRASHVYVESTKFHSAIQINIAQYD